MEENTNKRTNTAAGRTLPNSYEAEQAILGCALLDTDAAVHIFPYLKKEDFYSKAHAQIYDAMKSLSDANVPVDFVTVTQELDTRGETESAGGVSYISELSNLVPAESNYKYYLDIVKKNSNLRKLINISRNVAETAFGGDPQNDALATAEREIFSLSRERDDGNIVDMQSAMRDAITEVEERCRDPLAKKGVPTGFGGLDRILNGLQKGDLIIIAARPGQGKTSIGMNIIQHAALSADRKTDAGAPKPYVCAVFSLEMPAVQLAKRMLCAEAKVDMTKCNAGELTPNEWKRLLDAKARLDKSKVFIYDTSSVKPTEILSCCRKIKREHGLDLVMIDYLQLLGSEDKRAENRSVEVGSMTRTLKIAARELEVPILLLSQMNREADKRSGKRPQFSDLRESGSIEQDADIILFIYREHEPNDMTVDEATRNKVEIIVAKHRNGSTGTVEVRWVGPWVSFVDPDNSRLTTQLADNIPPPSGKEGDFSGVGFDSLSNEELLKVDPKAENPF